MAAQILRLVGLAACMAAFLVVQVIDIQRGLLLKGLPLRTVTERPNVDLPPRFEQRIVKTLLWSPLDQNLFNALYVYRKVSGQLTGRYESRMLRLIARQGWRSTSAQQNLMRAAAAELDVDEIVLRGDALLRREQLKDPVLQLLYQAEALPAGRRALLKSLRLAPAWRAKFFSDAAGIAGTSRLSIRAQTLNAMVDNGDMPSQSESAFTLRRMVENRLSASAYDLWIKLTRKKPTAGLTDSNFLEVARQRSGILPYPFEWQMLNGRGFSSVAVESAESGEVELSWDGRGSPVFMEQTIKAPYGMHPNLQLRALDADNNGLRQFAFTLECSEGQPVIFRNEGRENRPARTVLLKPQSQLTCLYPIFRVRGQPNTLNRPVEVSISYMGLDQP